MSTTSDEKQSSSSDQKRLPWLQLRKPIHPMVSFFLAIACIMVMFGIWWFLTRGEIRENRIVSYNALPSPKETWEEFSTLWNDKALARNTLTSLRRVSLGFLLATAIGIPVGVLAGCFPAVKSFLTPLLLFGRNIPIAALIPLTFVFFGTDELQKVIFIFIACLAFIISDTASSIADVGQEYVDSSYTLGASRFATIIKVLVPLAMPTVFDSLRLLFGLAFGYIMLAETVVSPEAGAGAAGLGNLISVSQRRGTTAHIWWIIFTIPFVAFIIDRLLYFIQRELFPFRYGGKGVLSQIWRAMMHIWGDLVCMILPPKAPFDDLSNRSPRGSSLSSEFEKIPLSSKTKWRP